MLVDIDNYYIEVNRSLFTDPQEQLVCNNYHLLTKKHLVDLIFRFLKIINLVHYHHNLIAITLGKTTKVNASVRTVSGTSSGGTEVSFIDQGFEPTALNETTFFPTPRLVASKVNEDARLEDLPKKKSLTLQLI